MSAVSRSFESSSCFWRSATWFSKTAIKPLHEARKDYVIVVAERLIHEHGLAYATVANILGTHERQLREWLGK